MIAAFLAGLLSFLSPCVLPLVPGYMSLISGASVDDLRSNDRKILTTVMLHSLLFILGFSVVFVTLGAVATELGQLIPNHRTVLARVAGVVIVIFGIHLTGLIKIKALYADKRLHSIQRGKSPLGAFLVGFAFAFGWTPCIGPMLGTVIGMAATSETRAAGIFLLSLYSLGLALPFLLISLAFDRFLVFYGRFRRHLHKVEIGSGILLIAIGILVYFNKLTLLASWMGTHEDTVKVIGTALILVMIVGLILTALLIFRKFRSGKTTVSEGAKPGNKLGTSIVATAVAVLVITGILIVGRSLVSRPADAAQPVEHADRFTGVPAPDFELKVLDAKGKTLKLSDFKGKAVVVNFWATWCEPCKVEMPWLIDLQAKYGPQGLQIVGIAMDDTDEKTIAGFARKMGVNYPIVMGTEKVADLYGGVDGMPTLFFVDRAGNIVDHELGLRGMDIIEANIKKSLGGTEASKTALLQWAPAR
jgi:cytochrome c-type biogenesis protein